METLNTIFGAEGCLASQILNYQPRDSQLQMAYAIADALGATSSEEDCDGSGLLVVEAETGIGKTLAYLIPAILSGKRIVVSTATLTLQDQIINKDIPLIEKALGIPVSFLCLKGRQNYLCLYRWYQYRSNPQLALFDQPWVEKIDSWIKSTQTGDRAELAWLDERSSFWSKVSTHSNQCLGSECPESSSCFVNAVRRLAGGVRLLVVNHHLFFSDLALKKHGYGDLFPRYEAVIFDEAHHIENVATAFFGKSFSHFQLLDLIVEVEKQASDDLDDDAVEILLPQLRSLRQRAENFSNLLGNKLGRFPLHELICELTEKVWNHETELLCLGISNLLERITPHVDESESWRTFQRRARELRDNVREIALGEDGTNGFVHWYEKRDRASIISATPIDVAPLLREQLYGEVRSCILTSATLSSGGSFAYIADRLGLGNDFQYLQFHSPFDYRDRTLLYTPEKNFPDPGSAEFLQQSSARIYDILQLSEGRALVLCTSLRAMRSYAEYLEEKISYPLLVQGTGSRTSLLQQFRHETNSVLLAVASFWEGVDIVGESLSCVVIDKLPFEVPTDPVIQARIRQIKEAGGNPFYSFQIPRAILVLKQGVGRLMRSPADAGLIAILDVRLHSKGYGKTFVRSLPPSPTTQKIDDVASFFQDLKKLFDASAKTVNE